MDFRLDFTTSCRTDEEPENYLVMISGIVVACNDDDDEQRAGSLRLFYADIEGAAEAGFGPEYILDMDAATWPYYPACFDPSSDDLNQQLSDDVPDRNLLILDRIELLPQFRGQRHGLSILYRCLQQFAHGYPIVVLKCFPLQFEAGGKSDEFDAWLSTMKMDMFSADKRKGTAKLKRHYRRLGFKSIGRSDFMFLNLAHHNPTLADI